MVQPIRPVWLKEKQWSCGPDSELKDLGVVFLCLSKRKPPCCLACISHSQLSLCNNYKTLIITALFISNILHLTVCITALQLDSITPEVMLLYWISSLVWSCHRPRAEDRRTPDDIQHNNVTSSVMLLQYNSSTNLKTSTNRLHWPLDSHPKSGTAAKTQWFPFILSLGLRLPCGPASRRQQSLQKLKSKSVGGSVMLRLVYRSDLISYQHTIPPYYFNSVEKLTKPDPVD